MSMRHRSNCPCCGRPAGDSDEKIDGGLSRDSRYSDLKETWVGIGVSKHFVYNKCAYCGTLFNLCYPDDSDLSRLYSSMPPNMDQTVSESDQYKNQYSYAAQIKNMLGKIPLIESDEVQFLELGSDRGLLAKALSIKLGQKLGKAVAIEPNKGVYRELKESLLGSSKDSMVYEDIKELLTRDADYLKKFDIIAAIHVLDHTYDPAATLEVLASLLSERGVIYFVVHNPNSNVARILGRRWPAFCAQHPQLFTPLGIARLANRLGFKILQQGRTKNHFSMKMMTDFIGLDIPYVDYIKLAVPLGNRYYFLGKI